MFTLCCLHLWYETLYYIISKAFKANWSLSVILVAVPWKEKDWILELRERKTLDSGTEGEENTGFWN